ncbi:MAG TPA: MgtC/SapB family protein [Dehalococcoidia bacterium]|nr:MgtC/SapB family protein [Dehalococcoidia bacterium]HIL30065.1 MgtC/SapB family protein [Dehalococcoidia bacterium]
MGYERRSSEKPAGLRTLSLVAVGSALFTIISSFGFETADQSRVAREIGARKDSLSYGSRPLSMLD